MNNKEMTKERLDQLFDRETMPNVFPFNSNAEYKTIIDHARKWLELEESIAAFGKIQQHRQ